MSARDSYEGGEYDQDDTDQLQPADTLADSELSDVLDRGYSPPDYAPASHEHDCLDERLAEEVPDVGYADEDGDPDFPERDEVGDRRAGRLIAPDEGVGPDVDNQLLATDAGVDGAGASAEEAAMHYIDEE
ncbi:MULTISPECIES: DUF5709 domain-containing protein [Gordonia]|uniref:DUF5709 domain-containing protein n=1 Tax=Gordonia cholesterolivorans TaxID=559625 RepID=A0ABP5V1Y9_9ACTN|nr:MULTISPECIES: DUF5709 domain-containing protein [Gordonia]KJR09485.1 hypothetical protein UG54_04365 [Gordonia sihwensis]KXT58407.1 hypothetical protein Y710_02480 [Gordonia sp. QH-12]MBY4568924.1 hypothetical protein [Gordonia sihwensis]WFN93129.1 DUF5709 domain-containing protein [Gordonia sihwensis]